NIIFLLIDDMGWSWPSCYGNEIIKTPNMDLLSNGGARFTDAYSMAQCSPARFAFLTGQSAARTNYTAVVSEKHQLPFARLIQPESKRSLSPNTINLGHQLKKAGYRVGHAGKWHVDIKAKHSYKSIGRKEYFAQYGFDMIKGPSLKNDSKRVMSMTKGAIEYLQKDQTKPCFVYLAHHTVHTKLEAPKHLVEKYINLGYKVSTDLYGKIEERPSAEFLGMLEYLDQSLGLLMKGVKEMDSKRQTLIVFMSDNGGLSRVWNNKPLQRGKGTEYEGGIRVPLVMYWPGRIKAGQEINEPVHMTDMFPTFLKLGQASVPEGYPLDGKDVFPLVTGGEFKREAIYIHMPLYIPHYGTTPSSIIRMGDYKLIKFYGDYLNGDDASKIYAESKIELFNVRNDLAESKNLALEMPDKAKLMEEKLMSWLEERNAKLPIMNPNFDVEKWNKSLGRKVDVHGNFIPHELDRRRR
ncbi:MAG: sulfatase, partial [Lentisphaeraceae bacterium]|nr:sulfatase [Lentisphaeraceae bacterium]